MSNDAIEEKKSPFDRLKEIEAELQSIVGGDSTEAVLKLIEEAVQLHRECHLQLSRLRELINES